MTKIDLTGKRFGRLTVIKELEGVRNNQGNYIRIWECKCDCGNIKEIKQERLTTKRNPTQSCGCYAIEQRRKNAKKIFTTHGGRRDRLYGIWANMKARCENTNTKEYSIYGGRGIYVCPEWHDYSMFKKWAYENGYDENAPRGFCTLDRKDNNGPYCSTNCRFVTMLDQANNTSTVNYYDWNGGKYTLSEIMVLSKCSLSRKCVDKRLRKGMSINDAITLPRMKNQYGGLKDDR